MKHTVNPAVKVSRLGVIMEPSGDEGEAEGILNPAAVRDREGKLLLYPRCVAKGNVSRIGIVRVTHVKDGYHCDRLGFALEPETEFELNGKAGNGCEDPRVTFVPELDKFLMGYTACGAFGPRIAFAWSVDGYEWQRIGTAAFPASLALAADDKDVAIFPEPVLSPDRVRSIAFYHRPMNRIAPRGNETEIEATLRTEPKNRQGIRIAYVPLESVKQDIGNILKVAESELILSPCNGWGRLKLGAGTPPVRIEEGWLSVFHGVDPIPHEDDNKFSLQYSAGIIIHDVERPHKVLYKSATGLLSPETNEELFGTVNNVVFPTAIDPRPDLGARIFDVYYGMADHKIGLFRLELGR